METLMILGIDDLRVRIVLDEYPENPRVEFDHVVHVVTVPNLRYLDVDKDFGPLGDVWDDLFRRHHWERAIEIFTRYARIFRYAVVFEHEPYNGPRSLWYVLPEDVLEHGIPDPEALIMAEVQEYDAWAEGDVYGYILERRTSWARLNNEGHPNIDDIIYTWDVEESCFGFYGYGYAKEDALTALRNAADVAADVEVVEV